MSYAEIMIRAYAETKEITYKEAMQCLKISDLVPTDKKCGTQQLSDRQAEEFLSDLRNDSEGVLAWAR